MIRPFIWKLKKQGIFPKYTLLDKGYNSENNHFDIREIFGSIGLIAPNMRSKKKKNYTKKPIKQGKKLLKQTTLDKYIPIRSRKKKYRLCCITLKEHHSFKKIFKERISVERYFGIIKRTMDFENHRMAGLKNIYKHVLIQCIAFLIKILRSAKLGILESMRSVRFFQN